VRESYNIKSIRSMHIKWWKQRREVSSARIYEHIYLLFFYKTEQEIEGSLAPYTAPLMSGWLLILKAGCGFHILKIYCKKRHGIDITRQNTGGQRWLVLERDLQQEINKKFNEYQVMTIKKNQVLTRLWGTNRKPLQAYHSQR
jgi:hypothetical protein